MKKQKFKRTFAGLLAIVLVCVMAITSYSPLTAYAEDGHFDITAPVIDDVDVTGVRDTYTKKDTLEFKVHAYDEGGSGLTSINLEFRVEKNDSYVDTETIYYSLSGEGVMYNRGTISYDEKTGNYTLGIPMSQLKQGYKYILNSIEAVDGTGNRTKADSSLIQGKISFVIDRKNNETVQVESVSILDKNNESVIGKMTTNESLQFYVALNNTENIERVNLEFRACEAAYDNKVVTCYFDGGKYAGISTVTNYLLSSEEIREYELVTVSIEDTDGNEEIIALPNETVTVSIQGTRTSKPSKPENNYKVESVKYYTEDGTEIKSTDVLTHGDKVKFQLKTSGIDQKIHEDGVQARVDLKAQYNKVDQWKAVDLYQNESDYNLFEGTLEIDSEMYPTVWEVTSAAVYGELNSCIISYEFATRPENILVKSKNGDIVLPTQEYVTINYSYVTKDETGKLIERYKTKEKTNVPYMTKLSKLDLGLPTDIECPIEGGKFLGWHVVDTVYNSETSSYDKEVDKGPVEDYVITGDRYISLRPVFDKEFNLVQGAYYENGKEVPFIEAVEGKWDEAKILARMSDLYKDKFDKDYGFKGFEFNNRLDSGMYIISPVTENTNITIYYKYVGQNGDLIAGQKSQFLAKNNVNNDSIKSIIESFGYPEDGTKQVEFEKWEYYFNISDEMSEENNIGVYIESKYKGKNVITIRTDYLFDMFVKCEFIDEDVTLTQSDIEKMSEKYRPSKEEVKGLDITGWSTDNFGWGENFTSIDSTVKVNNCVAVYEVIKEEGEIVNPKDKFAIREAKIYKKGEAIQVPNKIGNCKITNWAYAHYIGENDGKYENELDLDKEIIADKPGVYKFTCWNYTVEDATTPDPTPDPDKKPEVKPEQPAPDTKPEQKPEQPAPDTKPEQPTPDTNLNDVVVIEKVTEIKNTIEQSKNNTESKETPKVEIKMGTATVVPAKVLEAAKGSDVDIVLQMDGYSWTINGKDIKGVNLKDINLEVKTNTSAIPIGLISKLAGDQPAMQLSLTHNGDFGFKANLNVNVGKENAGQFGNLYYYDSDGRLVFMNAGKIAEDGSVNLSFSHASDYVIVIGKDMTAKENGSSMTSKTDNKTTNKSNDKKAVKTGDQSNIVMISVILLLSVACITALVLIKKKRK